MKLPLILCVGAWVWFHLRSAENRAYAFHKAVSQSYESGYLKGSTHGYDSGYAAGNATGYESGYLKGEDDGYVLGFSEGFEEGYAYHADLHRKEPVRATHNVTVVLTVPPMLYAMSWGEN